MLETLMAIAIYCDRYGTMVAAMQASQVCRDRVTACMISTDKQGKISVKTKDNEVFDCFKTERII